MLVRCSTGLPKTIYLHVGQVLILLTKTTWKGKEVNFFPGHSYCPLYLY